MKIKFFDKKFAKILFAIGCAVLAFVFWFVITYNNLGQV
jgi:hypothetical protein